MRPHCVMGHLKSSRSRALRKLVRTEKEGNAWGEAEIHLRRGGGGGRMVRFGPCVSLLQTQVFLRQLE